MNSEEIELANLIESIGKKIKKYFGCTALESEFSIRDMSIIKFIGNDKKTMGEIAEELELTPGTITPIIDNLIEHNLLQRERDDSIDRRKIFISLDKEGKEIYNNQQKLKSKVAKIMVDSFSQKDKKETIELMQKIAENLDKGMED